MWRVHLRYNDVVRHFILGFLRRAVLVHGGLDVHHVEDGSTQEREHFVREIASRAYPTP